MTDIKREAGDKSKGFTLQKQRALALFFDEIKSNPNAHINVAIEYRGDVYLQNEKKLYVEEQKNYEESTTFSFNSHQILNTLAYFIEIWLSESKSKSLKFGFYTTNKTAKEYITSRTVSLGIVLPKKSILELISLKNYSEEADLLEITKKYLVDEYQNQYTKDITSELNNTSLIDFFNSISWHFEQDNEKKYDKDLIEKIRNSEFAVNLNKSYDADIVYASLMLALEKKQDENDPILKFLRKDTVENVFLKVGKGHPVDIMAYKYLNFEFTEFTKKTKDYLLAFLQSKYFSNIHDKKFPELIQRKIARHNKEVKIERKNLEETNPEQVKNLEVIIRDLGDLINSERPTFLFGEIGSGKSTLLAHYYFNEIEIGIVPIFIPSSYLKGKVNTEIKIFKELINSFVNHELSLENKFFDLEIILYTKKEITLIVDGLDEFEIFEAQNLLNHLLNLSNSFANLRVIASGRPLELQDIVNFNEWNCLTTLDLTKEEVKQILKYEAIASGIAFIDAENDAKKRFEILNSKQELYSIATTPLIICLIRDFLKDDINSKTLGDILYDVFKKRLSWNEDDKKQSFEFFLKEFPNIIQREPLIGAIAYKIYLSIAGKINEDELFQIINSEEFVPKNTINRKQVVNDAINFFKNNFLQKIGENYSFQSHQLFQLVVGLHLYYQIVNKQEFKFKQSFINDWRIISFTAAIGRRKGEGLKIEDFFTSVLDELLISKENTPVSAILLAELRNSLLNNTFLRKVQTLGFRPLMSMGNTDSLAPQSYSYVLNDIGSVGFEWFFENYLSPKYPSRAGINDLAISILKYYLSIKNYKLEEYEKDRFSSIIPYHIAAQTHECNTLIPTIALVLPEKFEIKERCILIAQLLDSNSVSNRAEELLLNEWKLGHTNHVIYSLDLACGKDHVKNNALILRLKLEKNIIPKKIIDIAINSIAKGNNEIFTIIKEHCGELNLKSYLRYKTLNKNAISDSAAIILYKFYGERDLTLIGESIMSKNPWFDYKDFEREKILNDIILSNGEAGYSSLINHIANLTDRLGVPEIYLKYVLKCLIESNQLHLNEFLHVVRYLSKYTLCRYPEIRVLFIKLLGIAEYYEITKSMLGHLDNSLRYNAASILLVCFPESEREALEIIIRSAFKRLTDNHEFLRFCMKLNLSVQILDLIYDLLEDLPEISRLFAIKLLYHNNEHKLNTKNLDELLMGLMGKGNFLDWSGTLLDDGVGKVISKDKYFEFVKDRLSDSDYYTIQAAASNLINYHQSKLTITEKAKCWLFYVQNFDYSLIDFYRNHKLLFENVEFVAELKKHTLENEKLLNGKKFLFYKFYEVLKEKGDWKEFFLALLTKDTFLSLHKIEDIYELLFEIGKSEKQIGIRLGNGVKELMGYSTYNQDKNHNHLIPQLAVIAHEFDAFNNEELTKIIAEYRISEDEIACSLLFRLSNIPDNYFPDRTFRSNIPLFSTYSSSPEFLFNKNEVDKLLIDGEDIPEKFSEAIEWALINGIYTKEDLLQLSSNGNLSSFFATVISFCRLEKFDITNFFKSEEIGSSAFYARARTQHHKNILHKIKSIVLSDKTNKEGYIAALIASISTNNSTDIINVFEDLFNMGSIFKPILLSKLFEALLDVPYRLNLNLVYNLNKFLTDNTTIESRKELLIPIKQSLKAVLSSGNESYKNEFELMAWTLSLILLYTDGKSSEDAERGFLIGLRNVFVQDGQNYYGENSDKKFKGRDLFIHSDLILSQIDNSIIKKIMENGMKSDVPEVSSICKLFYALNN